MKEYITPKENHSSEMIVKKSRFIASIFHVETISEAQSKISLVTKEHYKATHNTYAFRLKDSFVKYSDDSEPSGTAGRPILSVLENMNIFDALIVVTRYFGGIKLGANGLVRAYSSCSALGIEEANLIRKILCSKVTVHYDYKFHDKIMSFISSNKDISLGKQEYLSDISVEFILPIKEKNDFIKNITELSMGKIKISREEDLYIDKGIEK